MKRRRQARRMLGATWFGRCCVMSGCATGIKRGCREARAPPKLGRRVSQAQQARCAGTTDRACVGETAWRATTGRTVGGGRRRTQRSIEGWEEEREADGQCDADGKKWWKKWTGLGEKREPRSRGRPAPPAVALFPQWRFLSEASKLPAARQAREHPPGQGRHRIFVSTRTETLFPLARGS